MYLVWIGLIIQIIVFSLLKPFINDFEVASIFLVGVNFLFFLAGITKYKKDYIFIFVMAYFTRIATMLWDIYATHLFSLPHSGIDSERFFYYSSLVSNNMELLKGPIYGLIYTKFLGFIFYITSAQKLIGQYINVLLGLTIIILVYNILNIIGVNKTTLKRSIILLSFSPHAIIFSGILLRENIITFFVVASFYYFIRWYKYPMNKNIIYSFLCIGIATSFHSGVIGIIVGYVFMYLFYHKKTDKLAFTKKTLILFIIFILISAALFGQTNNILLTKFNKVEKFTDIYEQANVRGGGSTYLTNLKVNSLLTLILYGPIKCFYFLTSPLPMNWRGVNDVVSFFMDSIIYLILIYYISINFKKYVSKSPLAISIFIMILIVSIIFGIGVANAGTAMRHRQKIFPIFIILYAIISDFKIRSKLVNRKY